MLERKNYMELIDRSKSKRVIKAATGIRRACNTSERAIRDNSYPAAFVFRIS